MPSPDLRALAADLRDVCLGDDPSKPDTHKLSRLSGHLVDNAREPYEKWAAGFLTDVEGVCTDAAAALEWAQDELDRKTKALEEIARYVVPDGGWGPFKLALAALSREGEAPIDE